MAEGVGFLSFHLLDGYDGGGWQSHADPNLGMASPFFVVVVFSRGDVLELWMFPVAQGGGCFGGPIF